MNNQRRKELARASDLLEAIKDQLAEALDLIRTASDDEREYYENMPESLQGSEKGQNAEQAADALGELADILEELDLDGAITAIDDARQ